MPAKLPPAVAVAAVAACWRLAGRVSLLLPAGGPPRAVAADAAVAVEARCLRVAICQGGGGDGGQMVLRTVSE